jgi:hypothetical protein
MSLNLLRKSRQHLQLSSAAHYHGMVDSNKIDVAPPGCKITAHMKILPNGERGHPMANMATLWGQKCTITGVTMFTSRQLPAKG